MAKGQKLVRFISPFGSPAWMTPDEAQRHFEEDDLRWEHYCRVEQETKTKILSDAERKIGPPRIERS